MALPFIALLITGAVAARAELVHRWSFNDSTGAAPHGTVLADSAGGAVATVRGTNANFTGTALTLPGSSTGARADSAIAAYVDLPNGIISSKTNLTVEVWATVVSARTWQRLFDFGRAVTGDGLGAPGEWTGATAPSGTAASDNLTFLAQSNTVLNAQILETRLDGGVRERVNSTLTTTLGVEYHFAVTYTAGVGTNASTGGRLIWYRNAVAIGTNDTALRLRDIEDVNNWLGRSQYSSDNMANIAYNEFRLYSHALTPAQVTNSFLAGPNAAFPAPVAQSDSARMHRNQKILLTVLANDSGSLNPVSVEIVQSPFFGTATPDGAGRILYAHTSGTPTADSFTYRVSGAGGASAPATVAIQFATSLRLTNNTLNVPSNPPPTAIALQTAFTGVSSPTTLAVPPGETNRLFVCEKGGVIRVFTNIAAASNGPAVFLNLPPLLTSRGEAMSTQSEQGLLGLAFHPGYATNRLFYIFYSVTNGGVIYERVSRFTTLAANPHAADTNSEVILISQRDDAGNHNGGDLHFGPDGYLYISLGDEGNQNDSLNNSQHIGRDFHSAIARIDVDKKSGSVAPNPHAAVPTDTGVARYAVPADNPFFNATNFNGTNVSAAVIRTEFWAVGLRNPWRMAFDPVTGELWCGDVGGNLYEEVDIITRGGNYGWAFREGAHNGPKAAQTTGGFTGLDPLYEYTHGGGVFEGLSITGGRVYRGGRIPSLTNLYIFSDYVSGHIWALRRNGTNAPTVTRIAGEGGIVAFGEDPSNGDLLLADFDNNRILRLMPGNATNDFPATLGDTGLFADLADLSPAPGLLPYDPNLPFWSDFAAKRRWFVIPDATNRFTWTPEGSWSVPSGAIWVKHFDMEMTRGNPATKKRLETRLLVRNAGGAYGVSYRWNDAQTEAVLAPDEGVEFDLAITNNSQPYTQRWRIPSRSECLTCHTPQAGHVLSFTTRQLNRTNDIHGFAGNQIELLHAAGYFTNTPDAAASLPRHVRPDETSLSVEARARSYLAVNCAYCHQANGTAAPSVWDGRPELTVAQMGIIDGGAANNGGNPLNKLLVRGDPLHSILWTRAAATNGFTRMPPLATSELDGTNIVLLAQWIDALLNRAPSLAPQSDANLMAGRWLLLTNSATDTNEPPQSLAFSFLNAPQGASLDATNGVLAWRPAIAQGGSTNLFQVVVTDDGSPPLSATQSFNVTVTAPATPQFQSSVFTSGAFELRFTGDAGPDYTIETSEDLTTWSALFTTNPATVPFFWVDRGASNAPMRFYRIILGP